MADGKMAELREAQHILKEVRQDLLNDILAEQKLSDNLIKEVQVWLVGGAVMLKPVDSWDVHIQMKINGELFHHVSSTNLPRSKEEMWKIIGDAIIKLVTDRVAYLLSSDQDQVESLNAVWK